MCTLPQTSQPEREGGAIITAFVTRLHLHLGGSSFLCQPSPSSAEEEKISAWRGHEDIGGEGQLGREPGRPGGDQFFPKRGSL